MRKPTFLLLIFIHLTTFAQSELNYPKVKYGPSSIRANWVSHPETSAGEDQVVLFRNTFEVQDPAQDFIINLSADNHYFLYVNGRFFTHGPQLSDIRHWKYETLNLKTYLRKGKNTVAVKVVNFGKRRFYGMQSIYTGLLVNGITDNAKKLSTQGSGDNWKCHLDPSYHAIEVHWRGGGPKSIVGGFYANNPTDFVDMNHYPTSWEQPDFDDSAWQGTAFFEGPSSMGGSMAYLLEPRNLPLLTWEDEAIKTIVRHNNIEASDFPLSGPLSVAPNTKATFLIDQTYVTNGFPELVFSKGRDSSIKIKYAENLFGPDNEKGDRNDIAGKRLLGYYDHIVSNGLDSQKFIPNWMRTFRFIEFEITTADEALTLESFKNYRSRSRIPSVAQFTSDNDTYNAIFDICKRTVDICTQDYFLSDAYYETMQYVGDTKIHSLVWQAMSGNPDHTENAIRQFHHSRDAEGNILGAYPLRSTFIYPTYSLVWVDMIYDHFKLTGDSDLIHTYKDGIVHTLSGFEKNMNALNLVDETPYRYFVDWYTGPNNGGGTATNNNGKNSAVVSLHYVHALQSAAKVFEAIGESHTAEYYQNRADEIKKSVYELCFDPTRNLFAERPDKTVFDQHTNIMAVLTDAIAESEQKALLSKILNDPKLLQATYYYRYYLFEAIKKVRAPELFALAQSPWKKMIDDHMTTTLERFESKEKPTRSEVHPWSASPALFYFDYLAGIASAANNFEKVRIEPVFGELEYMEGLRPTAQGTIEFTMKRSGRRLVAEIKIPAKMSGKLIWNGSGIPLKQGKHTYRLK
ncbi:alpha-L-rhamnosidase-related protein [Pseudozobellia thermophila]|uniref:Alpha-L-rhamnosidase n=1 Tax=Pseudozobellia thermophila TaxID=192903 RepID=A0A1M6D1E9_9FLAO|nr:family 78 glycoside hydrolase catalytic domain [Pseudozobellia thermophila]SHI67050.1 alpha-L-rhamnosidase [Pseudozobellia thermophila]